MGKTVPGLFDRHHGHNFRGIWNAVARVRRHDTAFAGAGARDTSKPSLLFEIEHHQQRAHHREGESINITVR
jgi:hypothetical protein